MKGPSTPPEPSRHRGITMHNLPVGGDFPGFVFAIGCVVIFLLALPEARWFAVGSVIAGVCFFGVLRLVRRIGHHND